VIFTNIWEEHLLTHNDLCCEHEAVDLRHLNICQDKSVS
jgi:hypothetical protein